MPVTVLVPTPLRQFTQQQSSVVVAGGTVGEALSALDREFPGIGERVCGPDGRVRRFVNVFVNGRDIRSLAGVDTPLQDGDELGIIPAIAGGA